MEEEVDGEQVTQYAFIDEATTKTPELLAAAKKRILDAFPGLEECKDPDYHYESTASNTVQARGSCNARE